MLVYFACILYSYDSIEDKSYRLSNTQCHVDCHSADEHEADRATCSCTCRSAKRLFDVVLCFNTAKHTILGCMVDAALWGETPEMDQNVF